MPKVTANQKSILRWIAERSPARLAVPRALATKSMAIPDGARLCANRSYQSLIKHQWITEVSRVESPHGKICTVTLTASGRTEAEKPDREPGRPAKPKAERLVRVGGLCLHPETISVMQRMADSDGMKPGPWLRFQIEEWTNTTHVRDRPAEKPARRAWQATGAPCVSKRARKGSSRGYEYKVRVSATIDGRRREQHIGVFNSAMEARAVVEETRDDLLCRHDAEEAARTIRHVCKMWVEYQRAIEGNTDAGGLSKGTLDGNERDLENHLLPVAGDMHVRDVSSVMLRTIVTEMAKKKLAIRTQGRIVRLICRVVNWARDNGWREEVLKNDISMPKANPTYTKAEPNLLKPPEIARLLWNMPGEWVLWGRMLWLTGMRIGELLALPRWAIDLKQKRIMINAERQIEAGVKNSNQNRPIPLDPLTLEWATLQLERTAGHWGPIGDVELSGKPFVFNARTGRRYADSPLTRENRLPIWKEAAGIGFRLTNHGARRSFNDALTRVGGKYQGATREIMGHKSEKMTRLYSDESEEDQRYIVDTLSMLVSHEMGIYCQEFGLPSWAKTWPVDQAIA